MFVDDEGIVYQMVDSAFKLALLIDRCNMDGNLPIEGIQEDVSI